MKKREVDFIEERNRDLLLAYKTVGDKLKEVGCYHYTSYIGKIHLATHSPAKRFYVSVDEAKKIIGRAHHGFPFNFTYKEKQNLYTEIYNRFKEAIKTDSRSIYTIIEEIVYSPAPSFYITDEYARNLFDELLK